MVRNPLSVLSEVGEAVVAVMRADQDWHEGVVTATADQQVPARGERAGNVIRARRSEFANNFHTKRKLQQILNKTLNKP